MSEQPSVGAADRIPGLDPIQAVRNHPEWFFEGGEFDVRSVVALLAREAALVTDVSEFRVVREGSWVMVTADVDWLGGDLEAFAKLTPFPEGGINATRIEVLLTAFCDAVVTSGPEGSAHIRTLRNRDLPRQMQDLLADDLQGRAIAFRVPGRAKEVSAGGERAGQPASLARAIATFDQRRQEFQLA